MKGTPKPMPRLNLTVEERAKLIAGLNMASKDKRLAPETRIERARQAMQMRRIQAKRVN
ncbi:MAG TPA: hypothetical protein VMO78_14660 [Rhizomicrobium sp.]|nr:hypothetical protein [Rhizomicrobium sp.]